MLSVEKDKLTEEAKAKRGSQLVFNRPAKSTPLHRLQQCRFSQKCRQALREERKLEDRLEYFQISKSRMLAVLCSMLASQDKGIIYAQSRMNGAMATQKMDAQCLRKFRRAVLVIQVIRNLIKMYRDYAESRAELLSFSQLQFTGSRTETENLLFDCSYFKAKVETTISHEAQAILSEPPENRTSEGIKLDVAILTGARRNATVVCHDTVSLLAVSRQMQVGKLAMECKDMYCGKVPALPWWVLRLLADLLALELHGWGPTEDNPPPDAVAAKSTIEPVPGITESSLPTPLTLEPDREMPPSSCFSLSNLPPAVLLPPPGLSPFLSQLMTPRERPLCSPALTH
ncbi:hypothetical protein UY3_02759 [Chelonia mydas]|uniref:Uncharacterized protein n=1 Tax=Chelonia mydas TaxID=8469 RepID=M7BS14_CHEMY|nr:hypothetical protein UY3_02759 [Chelonia mydas]